MTPRPQSGAAAAPMGQGERNMKRNKWIDQDAERVIQHSLEEEDVAEYAHQHGWEKRFSDGDHLVAVFEAVAGFPAQQRAMIRETALIRWCNERLLEESKRCQNRAI